MMKIYECEKCKKDGFENEFTVIKRKRLKNRYICKDCANTQYMKEKDKIKYFKAKEAKIRRKIRNMYSQKLSYWKYANQLSVDDKPIKHPDGSLIVKCTYCGRPFRPNFQSVRNRIYAINGTASGESRLYCSEHCKASCPTFNRNLWPAGFKKSTSREVQAELRQIRLEIDRYRCQKCGKHIRDIELHCHHITGVVQNPIESADIDNTITLCKPCHFYVHTLDGCKRHELKCG